MCIRKIKTKLIVVLTILVLVIITLTSVNIAYLHVKNNNQRTEVEEEKIEVGENTEEQEEIEYVLNENFENNWYIIIPKIGLLAPISEGTSQKVMRNYVGHFENTSVWNNNIGLAAHNRRISNKLF